MQFLRFKQMHKLKYRLFLVLIFLLSATFLFYAVGYIRVQIVNVCHTEKFQLNDEYLKFVLNSPNVCEKDDKRFIFAYVFTTVHSFERRELIRKTWANRDLFPDLKVLFVIGKHSSGSVNEKVRLEHEKYKDLIQGNFIDSYHNLAFKSLLAWKWINLHCSNAHYILKADDDVIVNSFNLMKMLKDSNPYLSSEAVPEKTFFCRFYRIPTPMRSKSSKYYVSYEEYSELFYNQYCHGISVLMSRDLPQKLYQASSYCKVFKFDDAYVGMVANLVSAKFENFDRFITDKNHINSRSSEDNLFVEDLHNSDDFLNVWNEIKQKFTSGKFL